SIPRTVAVAPELFSMGLAFRPEHWADRRLLTLPYFEDITNLFRAMGTKQELQIRFYVQGNFLGASAMTDLSAGFAQGVAPLLAVLEKARQLAAHLKIDPVLPKFDSSIEDAFSVIEELHGLIFSKKFRQHVPGLRLSFVAATNVPPPNLSEEPTSLKTIEASRDYKVFNQVITIGPIETELTELRLLKQPVWDTSIRAQLEFEGTAGSERILSYQKQTDVPAVNPTVLPGIKENE
ncbi:MAG TPA: hypothetical protein VE843_07300, partial [Ktedonobacteraceae bacterium]|nr:hypothetical protein [Ktedonobacteraceae bacterium]